MATLVSFHAHPDDEALFCGGTLARAADAGHRTVLVVATDGRRGELPPELDGEESLARRRQDEVVEAARRLGVHRTVLLGYHDSGWGPTAAPCDPHTFSRIEVDTVAGRLAAILTEEAADVLTIYDDHGIYPHPDHVHVHRVGVRAAQMAGTDRVFEATIQRRLLFDLLGAGPSSPGGLGPAEQLGLDQSDITMVVDVGKYTELKREAMGAHRSQPGYQAIFSGMDDHEFRRWFGREWFRDRPGVRSAPRTGDLMADD